MLSLEQDAAIIFYHQNNKSKKRIHAAKQL
jgi:hypothetical protein